MNPRVLKEEGFKWLDRVVNICAEAGIYTVLDYHAAAGGQNTVGGISVLIILKPYNCSRIGMQITRPM